MPAGGEIGIPLRQFPYRVNMIGQYANRDRLKRSLLLSRSINAPKPIDLIRQKIAGPLGQNDREEEQAACDFGSTILRHRAPVAKRGGHASLCPPYVLTPPGEGEVKRNSGLN